MKKGRPVMFCNAAGNIASYLRLSVTERCNMACRYCMPDIPLLCKKGLGDVSIVRIVRDMAKKGISKVRLTGGEPLVRRDIIKLIQMLSAIDGINTIAITTNGACLAPLARELKSAGISSINIHIDSLRPTVHKWITNSNLLDKTLEGIEAACDAGFREVKLNSVLMRGVNDDEVEELIAFASSFGIPIRFIELMPIGAAMPFFKKHFLSVRNVMERLSKKGELLPLENRDGQGPARYYRIVPSGAIIGFIGHHSMPACSECNRIRVLSDGTIKKCLMKINGAPMHAIGG